MNFHQSLNLQNKRVLILSCGGEYDIFCGIPTYLDLKDENNQNRPESVHLASFSFTSQNKLE